MSRNGLWLELEAILDESFNGQLILHCEDGSVVKYERRSVHRPRIGHVELEESGEGVDRNSRAL